MYFVSNYSVACAAENINTSECIECNEVAGTRFEGLSLEEIIRSADGAIFNNAAQVWNHAFYWNCLSPKGGGEPGGALGSAIAEYFGDFAGSRTSPPRRCQISVRAGPGW